MTFWYRALFVFIHVQIIINEQTCTTHVSSTTYNPLYKDCFFWASPFWNELVHSKKGKPKKSSSNLNLLNKKDLIMFQGWSHPPSIDRSLLWSWFWCVRKVSRGERWCHWHRSLIQVLPPGAVRVPRKRSVHAARQRVRNTAAKAG